MQLVESGAFEDEKVELLAGVVVAMTAQGDEHIPLVTLLTRLLARRLTDDFIGESAMHVPAVKILGSGT